MRRDVVAGQSEVGFSALEARLDTASISCDWSCFLRSQGSILRTSDMRRIFNIRAAIVAAPRALVR